MAMPELTRKRFELYAQLPAFRFKVDRAQRRVRDWLTHVQNPYIAFSSGKDSSCVLALVREQRPDTLAVYLDADCSFPESGELIDQCCGGGGTYSFVHAELSQGVQSAKIKNIKFES
jgi:3'-phosphoadenosine 5'-phosphosulfate sulfotransferase (PAPS reductase)/FAD synthetase